tara:strand:+ start:3959 stop:4321 length:363 start_codon:yes stop_codon:yes gene_type:complete
MKNTTHITRLLALTANVKLAHWQADSTTNDHKTLGKLYDKLDELVDAYAEITLGKNGSREITISNIILTPNANHRDILNIGLEVVANACHELTAGEDDDLNNILADITGEINRTKYLLQV